MDFGIFSLMGYRGADRPANLVVGEVIEQTRAADELGFAASWFAEHHFSNYAICPSPLMMVTACAPVTKRIKLATGVVILPLYNPARLLSEIAFADALSNGRLVLGVGSGYQPYEFERLQVDLGASKAMLAEFMEIIHLGLTQDFFGFEGQHYRIPETHIAPRPVQAQLPVWLAGDSAELQRVAARKGWGAIIAGRTGGLEQLRQQRERCVSVFAAEGVTEQAMPLAIQRHLCVSDDARVCDAFAESALYQIRLTTALRRRSQAMNGTMLRDDPFPEEPSIADIKANLMIGNAEEVAKKLVRELRALTPSHMCFYVQLGDFPHEMTLSTMERFMRDVVPMVEAELGPLSQIGVTLPAAA
jgi:alkanesulfonate monooxygenase SsuD/methylene tetrahydromethanopterin reductase-like flavin-dependent oxidoreductase (luciferase family)